MIVSHSRKFIYIKSSKTASSSMESALWESCDPAVDIRPKMSRPRHRGEYFPGANALGKHLRSHCWPGEIRSFVGDVRWREYRKIVCVRNPWDVLVSLFWHGDRSRKNEQLLDEYRRSGCPGGFDPFLRRLENVVRGRGLDWNHCFYFWPDGTLTADHHLRAEELRHDFGRLCDELELRRVELPRHKSRRRPRLHYSNYYDDLWANRVGQEAIRTIRAFRYRFEPLPFGSSHCPNVTLSRTM